MNFKCVNCGEEVSFEPTKQQIILGRETWDEGTKKDYEEKTGKKWNEE
jgi:hypothetical protein